MMKKYIINTKSEYRTIHSKVELDKKAKAKLKAITTMTLPATAIYKMAEAKLRDMK
mgnify:CR=1 FL=1